MKNHKPHSLTQQFLIINFFKRKRKKKKLKMQKWLLLPTKKLGLFDSKTTVEAWKARLNPNKKRKDRNLFSPLTSVWGERTLFVFSAFLQFGNLQTQVRGNETEQGSNIRVSMPTYIYSVWCVVEETKHRSKHRRRGKTIQGRKIRVHLEN